MFTSTFKGGLNDLPQAPSNPTPTPRGGQMVPMVLLRQEGGERAMDLGSYLLSQGLIDLTGGIDETTGQLVTGQFAYLDAHLPKGSRRLFINTPGGSVVAGLAIYDKMQRVKKTNDVETICYGMAASMGSILLVGGTMGLRGIYRHGRVMIHQPLQNTGQQRATSSDIYNRELQKTYDELTKIIADNTYHKAGKGVSEEAHFMRIKDLMREDVFFDADQALEFGLVDEIID